MVITNLKATRKTTSGSTTICGSKCLLKEIIVSDPGQKCIVIIKDDTTIKMLIKLQENTEIEGPVYNALKVNIPITTSLKVEMYNLDPSIFLNFNNPDNVTCEDLSGCDHDGTGTNMEGSDKTEDQERGKHISLGGTDEYITFGDIFDWNPTSEARTFSFWVKSTYATGSGAVLSKLDTVAWLGWDIYLTSAGLIALYACTNGAATEMRAAIDDAIASNTWTHVAISASGSTGAPSDLKFYINGALVDDTDQYSGVSGSVANSKAMCIGARNGGTAQFFTGKVDEVMIFERELSAAEVEFIYRNGYGYGATDGVRLGDITLVYEP